LSSDAVAFRFPTGTQYRMTTKLPKIGDVLREGDRAWVVTSVNEDNHGQVAVILEPAQESGN